MRILDILGVSHIREKKEPSVLLSIIAVASGTAWAQ